MTPKEAWAFWCAIEGCGAHYGKVLSPGYEATLRRRRQAGVLKDIGWLELGTSWLCPVHVEVVCPDTA